jgi:hypothetical protein
LSRFALESGAERQGLNCIAVLFGSVFKCSAHQDLRKMDSVVT